MRHWLSLLSWRIANIGTFRRRSPRSCACGSGFWGGQRPSLAHYVTGMGPMDGATAAGVRSCCLSSGSGFWGGQRPSLAHYVTGMGSMDGATAAGGRSCCLSSPYIQRHRHRSQAHGAEERLDKPVVVVEEQRDAVARRHPEGG